jgi:hypothetical protein
MRAAGVCLAKSQLFLDFDNHDKTQKTFYPNEGVLWSVDVPNSHLIGIFAEFQIEMQNTDVLHYRTVISTGGLPGTPTQEPYPCSDGHVRGWWPYSDVLIDCGDYDARFELPVGSNISNWNRAVECCDNGGPEEQLFIGAPPLEHTNRGLYGANLSYKFLLKNTGNVSNTVEAVCFVSRQDMQRVVWHRLLRRRGPHYSDLMIDANTGNVVRVVVAPGQSKELVICIANGGACTTPFNLVVTSPRIIAQPVGGGGNP